MAALVVVVLLLPSSTIRSKFQVTKRSSSAIAITADGTTLLVVNPDSHSLTVVDTASESVIAEISVGEDPRSVAVSPDSTVAYVANQGSDDVSVVT